jgi:hypothetical protein
MPLRYVAGRGWRGPRTVIVIGGVGQLSAGILAERRRAHKTMFRRSNREKGVRRGSGEPYRHSTANAFSLQQHAYAAQNGSSAQRPRSHLHGWNNDHNGTECRVMARDRRYTDAMRAATTHVGMVRSCWISATHVARRGQHGPQLLDFNHIFRLMIRAKESGRCLGLKSSSCEMTWRRRTLPAAPCRLALILAFLLFTAIKVRGRPLGAGVRAPPKNGAVPVCSIR